MCAARTERCSLFPVSRRLATHDSDIPSADEKIASSGVLPTVTTQQTTLPTSRTRER